MPTDPVLTVAVPTMNGARHLRAALRSIREQAGLGFEIVVSDDRSEDESRSIVVEELGDRARLVMNSERLGLAGNWNQCVRLCRTPLVAIVHQDDVLRPGHLARHAATLLECRQVGLAASASGVIDDEGRPVPESVVGRGGLGPTDRIFSPGHVLPLMAGGNPLRCSAVSLRVETHRSVGGFDPAWRYVVDWEFWVRASRVWSVAWFAVPSVDIRWHPSSETQRFARGVHDLEETEVFSAGLAKDPASTRQVRRGLARAYLNRAYQAARCGNVLLGRLCLRRALARDPGVAWAVVTDPRLAYRLLALGRLGPQRDVAARLMLSGLPQGRGASDNGEQRPQAAVPTPAEGFRPR